MPIDIQQINDGMGIIYKGTGVLSGNDILSAGKIAFEANEKTRRLRFFVDDFSDVTSLDISTEDIKNIVQQDKVAAAINPNIVIAVVANDDLLYGMSRMWEAYVSIGKLNWQTFTTKSLVEAQSWIQQKTGLNAMLQDT